MKRASTAGSRPTLPSAFLAATLVCALQGPAPAFGQEEPAVMPMELARVLFGGTAVADVLVGEVPPELGTLIPLEELGRVVGGFARSQSNGMVILAVEAPEDDAVDAFEGLAAAHGFSRPSEPERVPGGFLGSAQNRFRPWCGESVALTVTPVTMEEGPTYLRVSYSDVREGPCNPGMARRLHVREGAVLPTLDPLPGARVRMGGTGSSPTSVEAASTIESDLEISAVADHYARQLEEAGWTPAGETDGPGVVVHRFTLEEDGEPWVGLLAVWRMAPDRHQAIVRKDAAEGR